MITFIQPDHGTVYAMDDGFLISTPLNDDLTYDTCWDNWVQVDMEHCEAEGIDVEPICRFLNRCEDMACIYVS